MESRRYTASVVRPVIFIATEREASALEVLTVEDPARDPGVRARRPPRGVERLLSGRLCGETPKGMILPERRAISLATCRT
jgi:hypothetical protein